MEKNGRPWVLAEFPDEIEEDDAIFRIRFTGEVRSGGAHWHRLQSSCVACLSVGYRRAEGTYCYIV